MSKMNRCIELMKEIELYISYAVPEDEQKKALVFVKKYEQDHAVLALLKEHYAVLPDALEEGVHRVVKFASKQGVFLFVVISASNSYLYVVSDDGVVFAGEYGREIDLQILSFFDFPSQADFLKKCVSVEELKDFHSCEIEQNAVCPACGVNDGEHHLLGCTVEVCPWCDGQLSNCNCRFEKLKIDEIEEDSQLDNFNELLEEKGRVPFAKDQGLSYPGSGAGLDKDQAD